MIDIAQTGDIAEIIATILPCAWSYAEYAQRLQVQYADALQENFYRSWIDKYASEEYANSFTWLFNTLEALVVDKTEKQRQKIKVVFVYNVTFEYKFWETSYELKMSYK
jgi:thiaminase/transcriptional activator TenA